MNPQATDQDKPTRLYPHQHIGFCIGEGRAISTSSRQKKVVEHDVHFKGRPISQVFRHAAWEQT